MIKTMYYLLYDLYYSFKPIYKDKGNNFKLYVQRVNGKYKIVMLDVYYDYCIYPIDIEFPDREKAILYFENNRGKITKDILKKYFCLSDLNMFISRDL